MSIRSAEKAGSWYPAVAVQLTAMIESFPVCGEDHQTEGHPLAGIVPHAGLAFSGPIAARTYQALTVAEPETIIVFGAVHTMPITVPAIWSEGAWESPLGPVEVDASLAALLAAAGVGEFNNAPHHGDNSIELQIPLIKYFFPAAKVVPIATPPGCSPEKIGAAAWKVAEASGKRVVAVGSTDLTHYGSAFGVTPAGFGQGALDWAEKNDHRIIAAILNLDPKLVVKLGTTERSACGAGAAAVTTAFAAAAGAQGKLLEYTTSHHIRPEGEAAHFVGYAGIVFLKN